MLPRVVILNHSAKFFCNIQRALKNEPFDIYLYHQVEASIPALAEVAPALILVGQRIGYRDNARQLIDTMRLHPLLRETPVIVGLVSRDPSAYDVAFGVTVVPIPPDYINLRPLIRVMHDVINREPSVN